MSYANAKARTPQSEPFDCLPTSIRHSHYSNQLDCPTGSTGVHAVVHIDHSIVTSNVGNSTPVTASNKDALHKFFSEDLERQTPVNCMILQAVYVWEFLQDEQLTGPNTVSESQASDETISCFLSMYKVYSGVDTQVLLTTAEPSAEDTAVGSSVRSTTCSTTGLARPQLHT